jgi:hypothetical protein
MRYKIRRIYPPHAGDWDIDVIALIGYITGGVKILKNEQGIFIYWKTYEKGTMDYPIVRHTSRLHRRAG